MDMPTFSQEMSCTYQRFTITDSFSTYGHLFHIWYVDFVGLMLQVKAWLQDGKDVRLGDWKAADVEILNTFQLLTAKPVVYLVRIEYNISCLLIFFHSHINHF